MQDYLDKTERYLNEKLIPFWAARAVEPKHGGFQTNYDRDGYRTEVTEKSFLSQCRCVFTISHARRLGFEWPGAEQALSQGIQFLSKYFHDKEYDGYYWIVERFGLNFGIFADLLAPDFALNFDFQAGLAFRF